MICVKCGRNFRTKTMARACRDCREAVRERASRKRMCICWFCDKADGKCPWSRNFEPVPGWDATPVVVKDKEGDMRTYHIKSCPQFKEWEGN